LAFVASQSEVGLGEEQSELALRRRVGPYERDHGFDLLRVESVQAGPERSDANVLHGDSGASRAPVLYVMRRPWLLAYGGLSSCKLRAVER
jgi:hypothetical protein